MFWKAKVQISEQSYRISSPVIYLFRFFGVFPFVINQDKSGNLFMKWSPVYATYGFVLGIFLHCITTIGFLSDISAEYSDSIRVRSRTDVYVNVVDITATQFGAFFAIFILPTRFRHMFEYIRNVNMVDRALMVKHAHQEPLKQFLRSWGWTFVVFMLLFTDYLMYIATVQGRVEAMKILKTYGTYYVIAMILLSPEYQYQFIGESLQKRLKRLNKLLEALADYSRKTWVRPTGKLITFNPMGQRLSVLMQAYIQLTDACGNQNCLLGVAGAVILLVAFWHVSVNAYFLLSELRGNRQNPVFLTMKTVQLLFHIVRLLMVIEPWNHCCVEAQYTKKWVCKLRVSTFGRPLHTKLRRFQLILGLKEIQFSLAGVAVVDRNLFTTMMGAVSTYLTVLLQYQASDLQPEIRNVTVT